MKTKKHSQTKILFEEIGSTLSVPTYLKDHIVWLQGFLSDVPPGYEDTAEVSIEIERGFDGEREISYVISCERPETEKEKEQRIRREESVKIWRERNKEEKLVQKRLDETKKKEEEIRLLKELKAKYPSV